MAATVISAHKGIKDVKSQLPNGTIITEGESVDCGSKFAVASGDDIECVDKQPSGCNMSSAGAVHSSIFDKGSMFIQNGALALFRSVRLWVSK